MTPRATCGLETMREYQRTRCCEKSPPWYVTLRFPRCARRRDEELRLRRIDRLLAPDVRAYEADANGYREDDRNPVGSNQTHESFEVHSDPSPTRGDETCRLAA